MDKIQQYRQPMVTATGIFLGFMLNYVTSWMRTAFIQRFFEDIVIAFSTTTCISLLVIVLYRILRLDSQNEMPAKSYQRTFHLFLIGIITPFLAIMLIIIEKLVNAL